MINVDPTTLAKINSTYHLPSNQGEINLSVLLSETGTDQSGEVQGTVYEIGPYVKSGTINSRYDDYIYNTSLTVYKKAFGDSMFAPSIPLHPEMKMKILVKYGPLETADEQVTIGYVIVDEISWDDGETVTISGTNHIGHCLSNRYMGETIELTGVCQEVGATIMEIAGVTDYAITLGDYIWTYTYKSSDTCLSALEQMYPIFPKAGNGTPGFGILEMPSGKVVFGYWYTRNTYLPYGDYYPTESDIYSISLRYNSDKCYGKVWATGKAADGFDLKDVVLTVRNFGNWQISPNKIYFADFNGYTHQDLLADWADTVAKELENQGMTSDISGPMRPQLTVGDIAHITVENVGFNPEVITSITHHIGMDGFSTDYTCDSGGVYGAITGWSSAAKANGYNRRQKLADIVKEIAEQTSEEALSYHDPIHFHNEWDEEEGEVVERTEERNEVLFEYDGRNWMDLLPDDEEEEEES